MPFLVRGTGAEADLSQEEIEQRRAERIAKRAERIGQRRRAKRTNRGTVKSERLFFPNLTGDYDADSPLTAKPIFDTAVHAEGPRRDTESISDPLHPKET